MIVAEVKKVERVVVTMSWDDAQSVAAYLWERNQIAFSGIPKAATDLYAAIVKACK